MTPTTLSWLSLSRTLTRVEFSISMPSTLPYAVLLREVQVMTVRYLRHDRGEQASGGAEERAASGALGHDISAMTRWPR